MQTPSLKKSESAIRGAETSESSSVDYAKILRGRIESKEAKVAVIGLGYVGFPLALETAKAGYQVLGIDQSLERCEQIQAGQNYIQDTAGEGEVLLKEFVKNGKLSAYTEYGSVLDADIILICVPTPLSKNKQPDLSYIQSAVSGLLEHLTRGKLIILESTSYPGTTEELIQPQIEKLGFSVGKDFFLAFSPERIDPGNRVYGTRNTVKIVGGVTPTCLELSELFYSKVITQLVTVSSPRVAEMAKCFENIYRSVNIALVNELAILCERMDIDVYEVISAADTKPYGFQAFWPGPGTGGHCIPLDPHYLAWKGREFELPARFIELASEINESMPRFIVGKCTGILNLVGLSLKGAKILQLGITYKKDVDDYRESPSVRIYELLLKAGAVVSVCDPFVKQFQIQKRLSGKIISDFIPTVQVSESAIAAADLVLITTDHTQFPYEQILEKSKVVLDARNAMGFRGLRSKKLFNLSKPVEGWRIE